MRTDSWNIYSFSYCSLIISAINCGRSALIELSCIPDLSVQFTLMTSSFNHYSIAWDYLLSEVKESYYSSYCNCIRLCVLRIPRLVAFLTGLPLCSSCAMSVLYCPCPRDIFCWCSYQCSQTCDVGKWLTYKYIYINI